MRERESISVPRGWTGQAAWKGAGASLLLHLFVGAAMLFALSGPPKVPPQVIDLTLLPPAEIARRPAPPPLVAAANPSWVSVAEVFREPPALPAAQPVAQSVAQHVVQPVANPPEATAPASPSTGTKTSASTPGSPYSLAAAPAGPGSDKAAAGNAPGGSGAGPPAEDFSRIRDAIQHAIAYPAMARRMGWEGKVVVAFQLLSDGSVRDVRVVQGSGHAALDRGAIDAVRNASPFPRTLVEAEVITPVVYRLTTR